MFIETAILRNQHLVENIFGMFGNCYLETGLPANCFIAGGFARVCCEETETGKASDIDIFSFDKTSIANLAKYLKIIGFVVKFENPMVIAYKTFNGMDIQLIKPFRNQYMSSYGRPEEVISQFDFTVARAAIYFMTELDISSMTAVMKLAGLVDEDFHQDIKNKQLHIRHIVCPIDSVRRINKYVAKGFTIGIREILKLFIDWDERPQKYRDDLIRLLSINELTADEVNQLYKLLKFD